MFARLRRLYSRFRPREWQDYPTSEEPFRFRSGDHGPCLFCGRQTHWFTNDSGVRGWVCGPDCQRALMGERRGDRNGTHIGGVGRQVRHERGS